MTLDGPTFCALGFGVCIESSRTHPYGGLTVIERLRGGKVTRTADELREARRLVKARNRARDPEAARAANLRHQRAKRARDRAS